MVVRRLDGWNQSPSKNHPDPSSHTSRVRGERGGEVPEGFWNESVSFWVSDGLAGESIKNHAEPSDQTHFL